MEFDLGLGGKPGVKTAKRNWELFQTVETAKTKSFCVQEIQLNVHGEGGFYMGTLKASEVEAV